MHPLDADYILMDKRFVLSDIQISLQKYFMAVVIPNSTEYGELATCSKYMWYRDRYDEKGHYDLVLELRDDSLMLTRYNIVSRNDNHPSESDYWQWDYSDPGLFDGVSKLLLKAKGDTK